MHKGFRRIVAFLMVIVLLITMPGCVIIEGESATLLEGIVYVVTGLIQGAALAIGELILAGIFMGLDAVLSPLEESLGWGDWWDVYEVGQPVMRWYGRLIDPNGRFADFSEPDDEDSQIVETEPTIAETEPTTAETEPAATETEPATEPTQSSEEEIVIDLPITNPEAPKGTNSSWWGDLIGCDHTPHKYNEDDNLIYCRCKANYFSCWDDPEYWTYENFNECIKGLFILKDRLQYSTDSFMLFRGTNKVLLDLAKTLSLGYDYEDTLEKMEQITALLEKAQMFDKVYINFTGTADAILDYEKYDKKLSDSLTLLKAVIQVQQMLERTDDPVAACESFLDLTSTLMGTTSGVTGGFNTFLLVGLELLWPALQAYEMAMTDHLADLDIVRIAAENTMFTTRWEDLTNRAQNPKTGEYIFWSRYITIEHIMGTKVVYYSTEDGKIRQMDPHSNVTTLHPDYMIIEEEDGRKVEYNRLCLPSLEEVMQYYPNMHKDAQAYLGPYIMFCLDFMFKEILGISYQDYLAYLANE